MRSLVILLLILSGLLLPISASAQVTVPLSFSSGWNLAGNSLNTAIDVQTTFGSPNITSVWKWVAKNSQWAFYAPSLDTTTLSSYAKAHGYVVLSTINPGDAFWVNASATVSLGTPSGSGFSLAASNLVPGWNLVATGNDVTPATFISNVGNVTTLWAWDYAHNTWFFYAPSSTMASYILSQGYEDFGTMTLGNGVGFWVNYAGSNPAGTGSVPLTTVPTPPSPGNVIPLVVDAGPVAGMPTMNVGYVSVTVCTPGTSGATAGCQTIDHVLLDTGSYGLRLLHSQLSSSLSLPAATDVSGHAIAECTAFVIGVTWGSVRLADVYLGGEMARSIPLQDIGDSPAGYKSVPADCASTGIIQDTQSTLGANGILGVGLFVNDCDACLTQAIPAAYYNCTAAGCVNSTVTVVQMVKNPVAEFTSDNNGVMLTLPPVGPGGSTSFTGSVTFGIGTQSNNVLVGNVYPADSNGYFATSYKGVTMFSSFLDSGSNGFFFNDNSIHTCPDGWYCPSSTLTLSATNIGTTGSPNIGLSFSLVNADNLFSNSSIVAGNIGAPGSIGSFDWGLPFFYGRTVFTAISGKSISGTSIPGPFWAY